MVVGVIRKLSWEDIEDPNKVGESYEDAWMAEEDVEPRSKKPQRQSGKSKKEPQEGKQWRRPGGQMLPKVPVIDTETGEPTGKEVRVLGHTGGMGRPQSSKDAAKRQRRQKYNQHRESINSAKESRRYSENRMDRQAKRGHPGSILDDDDVQDLSSYHPSKYFDNETRLGRWGQRDEQMRPMPGTEEHARVARNLESGDLTIDDLADTRDWPDLDDDEMNRRIKSMPRRHWEHVVGIHGARGGEPFRTNDPMMEAMYRGKIPVEHNINYDPDHPKADSKGFVRHGNVAIPEELMQQIMEEGKDTPQIDRRMYSDLEGITDTSDDEGFVGLGEDKGTFAGLPWNEETGFTRGSPIDIAFQLLKAPADWEEMDDAKDTWKNYLEELYDKVVLGSSGARDEWKYWEQQDRELTSRIKASHPIEQTEEPTKPSSKRVGVVDTQPNVQIQDAAKIKEAEGEGIWFDENGKMQTGSKPKDDLPNLWDY